ncbi:MAG: Glu/Leu/Phe/Val dehydrogenase [Nitrospinaceae bacterium]
MNTLNAIKEIVNPSKIGTELHLPKKLELEPLPVITRRDRFSSDEENPPEQRIRIYDPAAGKTWGYVVVDNTLRGPGLGGIRIAGDLTLAEVSRLARTMTLKNSAACLPFGGGKSGLIADPDLFLENPAFKSGLIHLFAEAAFQIDKYIPAPDMGTQEKDIQQIYELYSDKLGRANHMRGGAGRLPEKGGIPIDAWGLTAHGLFAAARVMEHLEGGVPIKNARVVVQGYGNVGARIATKLHEAGAIIAGASDIHAALWNPKGLDIEEMNSIRRGIQGLQAYSGSVEKRFGPGGLDWLLEAPCDILVPAARPDAITARNADRIQCRMILQGANTPSNKMTEYYLKNRRNILSLSDFIVNVGGVIGCAVELKMTADQDYKKRVEGKGLRTFMEDLIYDTVSKNVMEIHQRVAASGQKDTIFREEAVRLARERLDPQNRECWL